MNSLKVKLLDPEAKAPTVAHPGEDLAYDLYALEHFYASEPGVIRVRTGIAANAYKGDQRLGLLLKTRSGMARDGFSVQGGVIDSRYTGEIIVLLYCPRPYSIDHGDKIAQAVPHEVLTGDVVVVHQLEEGSRGGSGFGSTGR